MFFFSKIIKKSKNDQHYPEKIVKIFPYLIISSSCNFDLKSTPESEFSDAMSDVNGAQIIVAQWPVSRSSRDISVFTSKEKNNSMLTREMRSKSRSSTKQGIPLLVWPSYFWLNDWTPFTFVFGFGDFYEMKIININVVKPFSIFWKARVTIRTVARPSACISAQ